MITERRICDYCKKNIAVMRLLIQGAWMDLCSRSCAHLSLEADIERQMQSTPPDAPNVVPFVPRETKGTGI